MSQVATGSYAQVNGINLYYEIHGEGEPLILLHGGLGAIEMFGENLAALAAGRQVIGVDLQGHGRTADIDRPITFEAMADDVAALIEHLGFKQVDLMGYSMGGQTAQQVSIRHPDLIRKLVLVSCPFKRSQWNTYNLEGMQQMSAAIAEPMKQTPMYALYSQIAPRVEDWPVLLTKLGNLARTDYGWEKDILSIKSPTLLVAGDADAVLPRQMIEFFELLGGGLKDGGWDGSGMSSARLAILPGMTHYNIFNAPKLVETVIPFLDGAT
ncbi:MAG: alpha/beta fold hydrolase [Chloroflexi bacterium]|nr:alpha/beta fold hydrolase [Chloroflexota bacterium]